MRGPHPVSATSSPARSASNAVTAALFNLVTRIPTSREAASDDPKKRAQEIARATALSAAGLSGALAIPPGPLGLATIIPDLMAIWRLQREMVSDIASVYGKSAALGREAMVYCLFKHAGAALVRDIVTRVGERFLVRRMASTSIRRILDKLGLRLTGRVVGKTVARWIPLVGAVGVGAYAYYDTVQVAATAIDLFSKDIGIAAPESEG